MANILATTVSKTNLIKTQIKIDSQQKRTAQTKPKTCTLYEICASVFDVARILLQERRVVVYPANSLTRCTN